MTDSPQPDLAQQLKRLKKRAEVSRHAHGREFEIARKWRRWFDFAVAVALFALSVLTIVLYRNLFPEWNNKLMVAIAILPPLMLFVRNISGIFGFAVSETRHEIAVNLWGEWIRECNFLEKKISALGQNAQERVAMLEAKYVTCMDKTPLLPSNKFLSYKEELANNKQAARKIDKMGKAD